MYVCLKFITTKQHFICFTLTIVLFQSQNCPIIILVVKAIKVSGHPLDYSLHQLCTYSNSSICIIYENAYSSFSSGLQEDLIIQAFKLLFTIQDKCLEIKFQLKLILLLVMVINSMFGQQKRLLGLRGGSRSN